MWLSRARYHPAAYPNLIRLCQTRPARPVLDHVNEHGPCSALQEDHAGKCSDLIGYWDYARDFTEKSRIGRYCTWRGRGLLRHWWSCGMQRVWWAYPVRAPDHQLSSYDCCFCHKSRKFQLIPTLLSRQYLDKMPSTLPFSIDNLLGGNKTKSFDSSRGSSFHAPQRGGIRCCGCPEVG